MNCLSILFLYEVVKLIALELPVKCLDRSTSALWNYPSSKNHRDIYLVVVVIIYWIKIAASVRSFHLANTVKLLLPYTVPAHLPGLHVNHNLIDRAHRLSLYCAILLSLVRHCKWRFDCTTNFGRTLAYADPAAVDPFLTLIKDEQDTQL